VWNKSIYPRNVNDITHIAGIWQSNKIIENTTGTRPNQKGKIQDGGNKTGINDISACRQVSNETPTATFYALAIKWDYRQDGMIWQEVPHQYGGNNTSSNNISAYRNC